MVHSLKGSFCNVLVNSSGRVNFWHECDAKVMFVSYGHTTLDIPDPIRTPKSSRVGLT